MLLHRGTTGDWDYDGLANWEGVDVVDLLDWGFDAEELGIISGIDFKEYDEDIENEVEYLTCPECGHKWAK